MMLWKKSVSFQHENLIMRLMIYASICQAQCCPSKKERSPSFLRPEVCMIHRSEGHYSVNIK